jgi:hypothetical protein
MFSKRSRNGFTERLREEAVREAERDALTAIDNGVDIKRSKMTIGELVDKYIENRKALGKGAKTIEEYTGVARNYIKPHLGDTIVQRLRPAAVGSWLRTILAKAVTKRAPSHRRRRSMRSRC